METSTRPRQRGNSIANTLLSSVMSGDHRPVAGPGMIGVRSQGTLTGVRQGRAGSVIATRGHAAMVIIGDGRRGAYWVDGGVRTCYGPAYAA